MRTILRCLAAASVFAATAATFRPASLPVGRQLGAPFAPPAPICDNASLLTGPAQPPPSAVTVPAGDDSKILGNPTPSTTYWFAPGTHTLSGGVYAQVVPANGDTFIGGPGAIFDGMNVNKYAFTGKASNVTIAYLTIQRFGKPLDNGGEGVVNHDSGHGWLIQYNTVQNSAGAGVFIGTDGTTRYNCLRNNGEYGFQSGGDAHGASREVLDHNEISGNNTDNWEKHFPGCGCSGAGKFWDTNKANVTNNWIHDNRGPGPWMDTDNNDFDVEGNLIAGNQAEGIIYEISYNALIKNNTFVRNAIVAGPKNPGFPTPALYVSESGGDGRAGGRYSTIEVTGNRFVDNWAGVVLWENADRFCNSPANSSSGYCTLVNPKVVNLHTCVRGKIQGAPYYSDCRWKTQNVQIDHNTFSVDPAKIKGCAPSVSCGLQGLFSNYGTYPKWSPYQGDVIEQAITFQQNNVFSNNAYSGPWLFMAHDQGTILDPTAWQAAPYNQDAGSRFST